MRFVVVGAGIQGIYGALLLRKLHKSAEIHLIETSNQIGGLYTSFEDKEGGTFDKGMHIIYDTLNEDIDTIISSALPKSEWIILEGNKKDIAGVLYQNKLSTESPYINISHLNNESIIKSMGEIMKSLDKPLKSCLEYANAAEYFQERFGNHISDTVIDPIIKKLWKKPASKMHPASTRLVLMDRICLYNEECTKDLIKAERIRKILGYPNQLTLDLNNRTKQRGLYPKNFGLRNLINGLTSLLERSNIRVHLNTYVKDATLRDNNVESIQITKDNDTVVLDDIRKLIWCAPINSLGDVLGIDLSKREEYDPPLIQKYVYVLSDIEPVMGDIYYYYSFDEGTNAFRVTNYASYCPDAVRYNEKLSRKKLFPLCVEMHFTSENKNITDEEVLRKTVEELMYSKVIPSASSVKFSKVISTPAGFPLLTNDNCRLLSKDRSKIMNLELRNLILSGQIPEKGIFFLHETLSALHEALK